MRLSRHFQRLLACGLVGLLLFAQAAFAARPCVESGMSAASALAAQSEHECCGTSVKQVNLCVAKCTENDKLSGHAPLVVPPPSAEPILTVAITDPYSRRDRDWRGSAIPDPPKTVRFCTLLI